ncbi:MAG TPA: proteasome assembly chaperone family protein [Euryarchaeota archaeon]|nr:MAG: proteasome assembly chaperone family protein [Thermoplasmata archaeon]HHD15516.1 proteasome assembly chaperone family protein [Euryarchaeota archaeon]
MQDVIVKFIERPELKNTMFIEGLPGVGNVGKLAAEHLVEELSMKPLAEIYSRYLPPQVTVDEEGIVSLVKHILHYGKGSGGKRDIMVLTGDFQGLTPEGQYELSNAALDIAMEFDVTSIFTLGGYGVIKLIEEPGVLGAVTHSDMKEGLEEIGVTFKKGEPSSGIIGASGLLLGLGALRGLKGACLMGETSGYFVDPRAARAVLNTLGRYLDIEIDLASLEEKAKQIDEITSRIRENLEENEPPESRDELRYFG